MKKPNEDPNETLLVMKEYFDKQNALLSKLSKVVCREVKAGRAHKVYPLLVSIVSAGKSISLLIEQKLILEAFIMFRAFIERSINLCYLLLCDDNELANFIDYGLQKGYRTTYSQSMAVKHLGTKWNIPKPTKEILNKVKKFTSSKGKEITRWTKLSFGERIEFINNKTEEILSPFHVEFFKNIYTDGSESSHGTFYGSLLHMGFIKGIGCPTQGERYLIYHTTQVLLNLGFLIDNILKIISANSDIELTSFLKQSAKNDDCTSTYFKKLIEQEKGY